MAVTIRHLLPHERRLADRILRKLSASPNLDVARAENEQGTESLMLAAVYFVDMGVGGVILFSGIIIAIVIGRAFHEATIGLAIGYSVAGIGFASILLAFARKIQGYRILREYRRTRSPSFDE